MTPIPKTIMLCLFQVLSLAGVASAGIPTWERDALVQFYEKLQGDGWAQKAGWKQPGLDPCSAPGAWFGVQCNDARTNVVKILLPANHLVGDLGVLTKFHDLAMLDQLELWNKPDIPSERWNHLNGNLPPNFASLTELSYIDLSFNEIADSLDAFVSLSKLTYLGLEENQFHGSIPADLGELSGLTLLTLNGNQLTDKIPLQLGSLINLTKLWLYNNALDGAIPAELGDLVQLTELRLGGNSLSGGIPPSLGRLKSLERLELGLAFLDGKLPTELEDLKNLKILSLGTNRLSGDLGRVDWSQMTSLEEVYLDTNLLSGPLPESVAKLSHLKILRLRANALQGDVPASYLDFLNRGGELDLRWNALDPPADVTQTLDLRSSGEFSTTQTVAPRSISAAVQSSTSIFVSWAPISYSVGGGGYRVDVFADPSPQADPIRSKIVAGKEQSSALVDGVPAGPVAFVRIKTFTDPRPPNPGRVESDASGFVQVESASGAGVARFERERYVVREGDVLNLRAQRVQGSGGSLAATVLARPGSATADDFDPPSPTGLLWPAGDTADRFVRLATVGDSRQEPTEVMDVALVSGATESRATVEIGDRVVAGTAGDPVIATNSQGLSFQAWTAPQDDNSTLHDVFGRFLDPTGRVVTGTIEVAANQVLDEHDPEVVALEDNTFVVAWIQNRPDDSGKEMCSCRPTAAAAKCTRPIRVPGIDVSGIALAAAGTSYWLGWTTPDGFFAQAGETLGVTSADVVSVASPPLGSAEVFIEPRLLRLRSDRLVAVWNSVLEAKAVIEPGGEVQAQVFTPDGHTVGPLRRFGGAGAAAQRGPRAVRVNDTVAFLAWVETGKSSVEGPPQIAWSAIRENETSKARVARLALSGESVGRLEVLRQVGACQLVWLGMSVSSERFERRVVPSCSADTGSQGRPILNVDALEGRRESFSVTSTSRGLLFVEELVANRGVRWLKAARPPNL